MSNLSILSYLRNIWRNNSNSPVAAVRHLLIMTMKSLVIKCFTRKCLHRKAALLWPAIPCIAFSLIMMIKLICFTLATGIGEENTQKQSTFPFLTLTSDSYNLLNNYPAPEDTFYVYGFPLLLS